MLFSFFQDNFITSLLIVIVLLLILYFIIKFGLPVKSKKGKEIKEIKKLEEQKVEVAATKDIEKNQKEDEIKSEAMASTQSQKDVSLVQNKEQVDYEKKESEFNEKYQFEQVSSGVSKLKLKNANTKQNLSLFDNYQDITKTDENFLKSKIKLSEAIKNNNFDKLFTAHLSDKYDNIDPEIHLKSHEKLFNRANDMLNNSKQYIDEKDYQDIVQIENEKRESLMQNILNEIDDVYEDEGELDIKYIDVKTMIISELLLNRKKSQK